LRESQDDQTLLTGRRKNEAGISNLTIRPDR